MRAVYIYKESFRRMGDLSSVFVADDREADPAIAAGKVVYLGEVLGKHSNIFATMNSTTTKKVTTDSEVVGFVNHHGPFGTDLWGSYKDELRFGGPE